MSDAEDNLRKLTAAFAEIARLTAEVVALKAEIMRLKAASRAHLPYDAMGGYEF